MKTIGLDMRMLGVSHGGIGRYCRELFPRILASDLSNRYLLFYNKNSADSGDLRIFEKYKNASLIATGIRHYSLGEQLSFLRVLNKSNLDLVHFPNFNAPLFYKRPFVATIHDLVHHKIGGAKKSHYFQFLAYKKIIQNTADQAKSLITVSEYSKKDIENFLQISPAKINVIYEGSSLDPDVPETAVAEVKKRYLLDNPYLLFVGVMERKKNLVNLTRGFDYFLQKHKVKLDLVIVGGADRHYPDIKHKAMDIKNSNRLAFLGFVLDEELRALYKGAYAFVSASAHEGFGLPGVEALAFGLPLLVSNIEVFNEIYDNAGIYFNPFDPADIGEKIQLLARDSQFYEQIQRKSFERSQLFSWDRAAEETLHIYSQALNPKH